MLLEETMNKVMRALLLAVLALVVIAPAVAAQPNSYVTINGKIWNGTNGGPEVPVTVRVYRDTGAGDEMIREQFTGGENGEFAFVFSAVQGYYTLEIDAFVEGGSDALGVNWWQGETDTGRLLKKEDGGAGPWTFEWYQDNDGVDWWYDQMVFEYTSVAGPRANASWMYVAGHVFDVTIPSAMTYNQCGDQLMSWQDVDPYQAVEGVAVYVDRISYFESDTTNGNNIGIPETDYPDPVEYPFHWRGAVAVTGDKGFYGAGVPRQPGMYRVMVDEATISDGMVGDVATDGVLLSVNPLYFQVFNLYGMDMDPGMGYGPGSAWLPWDMMQPEWVYDNLNFMCSGTWTEHPVTVPDCPPVV
jgi:opacity protein-like surface antigen